MRKIWAVLAVALVLAGLCCGMAEAATKAASKTEYVSVYINGEKSDLQAMIVNGTSYLPLRELSQAFALDISWEQKEKLVELRFLNKRTRVWVERNTYGTPYWDGEVERWFEQELEQPALARNGRVWLPLRFFDGLTEAKVYWDEDRRGVCIGGIPLWQGDKWTFGLDEADYLTAWETANSGWAVMRAGSPIMGTDYLWRLKADGAARRVSSSWLIEDIKAYGGKCYCLVRQAAVMYDYFEVWQLEADGGEPDELGAPGFVYNVSTQRVNAADGEYYLAGEDKLPRSWWVDADGVWAMGMDAGAILDYAIDDAALARETYGLYRLYPGGHELVQKYDLPE